MGKLRSAAFIVTSGSVIFASHAVLSGNEKFYKHFIMPCFRLVDAETSHVLGVKAMSFGMVPLNNYIDPPSLTTTVWGKTFSNPIGTAAGFDKHAEAMVSLHNIGFSFVEVGSVTPLPQDGNSKPRVFRLTEDDAVINRYGFNSVGHTVVAERMKNYRAKPGKQNIVGINLGKNKTSDSAIQDYVLGVERLGDLADYLVVNVSSPNTPGLRDLQGKEKLQELIVNVLKARDSLPRKPPVLIKIAPDLTSKDKHDIADVILDPKSRIDGLIVSNTTITRPSHLKSTLKNEAGGLSGKPVRELSTDAIREMYKLTDGKLPIIGVGGVSSGRDAYDKIKAGASLVQLYTAMAFLGPPLITTIKKELEKILREDGFNNVSEAVGLDHR
ncbi:dihydroorotate dehydrogenase (quinone), mitochondrial-like [Anneissia japonica]|uniref:dihydroorotate dehydrogenase (quinone), mitochondrial-like n=1 Tax=Anneissia japonica TaxID=1529436 RepID=UPI0014256494|nr:dihydroorotate dehydrogenase (quinone), mitochondrial-like [Anneissia japonica]